MALRAVIFDLDDTLVAEEATVRRSLEAAARRYLGGLPPRAVADAVLLRARRDWLAGPHHEVCELLGFVSWEGLWSAFSGCHARVDGLRSWAPGFKDAVWHRTLDALGIAPALAGPMADCFVEAQRLGHRPLPGAAALLAELSEDLALGLLTNGPADVQRLKVETSGLGPYLDSVAVSGEVGLGKPDPAVFGQVLDDLGVHARDAVMVGDSWERDVVGALGAGMGAIWISRGRPVPDPSLGVRVVPGPAQVGAELRPLRREP